MSTMRGLPAATRSVADDDAPEIAGQVVLAREPFVAETASGQLGRLAAAGRALVIAMLAAAQGAAGDQKRLAIDGDDATMRLQRQHRTNLRGAAASSAKRGRQRTAVLLDEG
jgi:hypothetical protein